MNIAAERQDENWNALDACSGSDGLAGQERLLLLMLQYFNNTNFPACKMTSQAVVQIKVQNFGS